MNQAILSSERKQGYVKSSALLLIAFASAFLSRLLDTAGAPALVNFLHFATVPFACAVAVFQTRTKDKKQIAASKELLFGLLVLLTVTIASAVLNDAGIINVILGFLLLAEPFMLLLGVVSIPLHQKQFAWFSLWITRFSVFHILLALMQKVLIDLGILRTGSMSVPQDNIQGVFYLSGGGHVVAASVSVSFGLYYFISNKAAPLWMRIAVLAGSFLQLLFADAKQVLLVCLAAWVVLILVSVKDFRKTLQYIIGAAVFFTIFIWCMQNLELFRAFKTWIRPEIYGPEGEATLLKLSSFRIIHSYYESPLNWLFGLGPGHTVGRLGGWMLTKYWNLLGPLGATIRPIGDEVWAAVVKSWLGSNSSMFSPLFGWAAVWGDFGFFGLGAYLYLWLIVWRKFCVDDLSKFLVLTVLAHGFIFTQMEEPGYMLFIALLIGLAWHKQHQSFESSSPAIDLPSYVGGEQKALRRSKLE